MRYLTNIAILLLMISCDHIDARKQYIKGLNFYENSEYEKAIETFSSIINQTDTCLDCYLHRGFSYRNINQPDEARADFNKLIGSEKNIDKKIGYVNRGGTFYDQREYELALHDYRKALEFERQNVAILNMVSHMYFATNNKDSGCYYYWESVKIADTDYDPKIPIYCDSLVVK